MIIWVHILLSKNPGARGFSEFKLFSLLEREYAVHTPYITHKTSKESLGRMLQLNTLIFCKAHRAITKAVGPGSQMSLMKSWAVWIFRNVIRDLWVFLQL